MAEKDIISKDVVDMRSLDCAGLLDLKFGDLPIAVEQRIEDADEAVLLRWSERVLTAACLENVLN